jgi:tartronate-semialdehyde synthase
MTRMTAAQAAVEILKKEGVTNVFGLPGAAINPFYKAMKTNGGLHHTLARHVEGASHMAEGYTRAKAGNIGVCVGTSGPAGTDMITGLYSASADSIPILCITGQAPVAKLHKEDFQAVDIASIAKPLTKMAVTVLEAAQVPGTFQQAFHLMRSGRPGPVLIDLPIDVQMTEIEFDVETYAPLSVYKPTATRPQVEKALDMLAASERPLIVAGGGIINADAADLLVEFAELTGVPVVPTLMGWGTIPDDHELNAGMVGLQTSHRYGNATMLESDFVLGIGNRWANRHTGDVETYTKDRTFVHVDIEPTQIGRVFAPDFGIVSDAKAALELFVEVARARQAEAALRDRAAWAQSCRDRKASMWRKTNFDVMPVKPQRVYQEMNKAFGKDVRYVSTIGLSQIQAAQLLHVYKDRHWINAGQAGPLGWTVPAALGVATASPGETVVALSGDYDFQFMVEELAVGAQFNIPYIHVLVNNAYLGLIRQSQRGFDMDYCVQLSFDNINSPEVGGYGVDHVKVVEGLGCKAIRVFDPEEIAPALEKAKAMAQEYRVPVVVEVILERVERLHGAVDRRRHRVRGAGRRRPGCPDRAVRQPGLGAVDDPRPARPGQVQGHAHRRAGRGSSRGRPAVGPPRHRDGRRARRRRGRRHPRRRRGGRVRPGGGDRNRPHGYAVCLRLGAPRHRGGGRAGRGLWSGAAARRPVAATRGHQSRHRRAHRRSPRCGCPTHRGGDRRQRLHRWRRRPAASPWCARHNQARAGRGSWRGGAARGTPPRPRGPAPRAGRCTARRRLRRRQPAHRRARCRRCLRSAEGSRPQRRRGAGHRPRPLGRPRGRGHRSRPAQHPRCGGSRWCGVRPDRRPRRLDPSRRRARLRADRACRRGVHG